MSLYASFVPELTKMLQNLDAWLGKAVDHAKAKPFDPAVLLVARLAPDQYTLTRQIQAACDAAKFAGARLAGKEAPKHADGDQSLDELRARIASVVEFLKSLDASAFEGAETRVIPLPFMPGKGLTGHDYLVEMALPNFYFHLTTAYAILRHNGVPLGKMDFIGSLSLRDA
jgi:hypothetical protein